MHWRQKQHTQFWWASNMRIPKIPGITNVPARAGAALMENFTEAPAVVKTALIGTLTAEASAKQATILTPSALSTGYSPVATHLGWKLLVPKQISKFEKESNQIRYATVDFIRTTKTAIALKTQVKKLLRCAATPMQLARASISWIDLLTNGSFSWARSWCLKSLHR